MSSSFPSKMARAGGNISTKQRARNTNNALVETVTNSASSRGSCDSLDVTTGFTTTVFDSSRPLRLSSCEPASGTTRLRRGLRAGDGSREGLRRILCLGVHSMAERRCCKQLLSTPSLPAPAFCGERGWCVGGWCGCNAEPLNLAQSSALDALLLTV